MTHSVASANARASARAFAPASVGNVAIGFDILGFSVDAIGDRATALGVCLDDARLRSLTAEVKRRGDDGPLDVATLDALIVSWARA